jgi:GGDEF domain-containing protein
VLLPGADELDCRGTAKRIQEGLAAHPGLDGFPLSASVGYAAAPPAPSITDALRIADERMYRTKQHDEPRKASAA